MDNTILDNVNKDKIESVYADISENVTYFDETVKGIVDAESTHLDSLMQKIYQDLSAVDIELPVPAIEKYLLELSNVVYFMGPKLEKLSVRSDMAKAAAREVYNNSYLESSIKGIDGKAKITVAENQATAERASIYQSVVQNMYEHATKQLRFKIDAANTMISSLSKVLSRRIQEMQLSSTIDRNTVSGKTVLLENRG